MKTPSEPQRDVPRSTLVRALDDYFDVERVSGDSWTSMFDELYRGAPWRELVEPLHLERWNGLMIRGRAEVVTKVVTCVFPSEAIIGSLEPGTLLFTEHALDLVDDLFTAVPLASLERLRATCAGLYQVHATLDHHAEVSPSALIAKALGLREMASFYPIASGIAGGTITSGRSDASIDALAERLARTLGEDVPVRVCARWRTEAGRVAIAAGGGAEPAMLAACVARGCDTYVTGNAITRCTLPFVVDQIEAFTALAYRERVTVIDGTHDGTERPSQLAMVDWFRAHALRARFAPR